MEVGKERRGSLLLQHICECLRTHGSETHHTPAFSKTRSAWRQRNASNIHLFSIHFVCFQFMKDGWNIATFLWFLNEIWQKTNIIQRKIFIILDIFDYLKMDIICEFFFCVKCFGSSKKARTGAVIRSRMPPIACVLQALFQVVWH